MYLDIEIDVNEETLPTFNIQTGIKSYNFVLKYVMQKNVGID